MVLTHSGCVAHSLVARSPNIQKWNEWIKTHQDRGVLDVMIVIIIIPSAPGAHLIAGCNMSVNPMVASTGLIVKGDFNNWY